jgi:hypothetical protein
MAGTEKIPILIVSDCEPDPRETKLGDGAPWIGFERYFEFLSGKRAAIAQRTGAPAHFCWCWRMDPQIALTHGTADWALRTYASEIAETKRRGDDIAAHVHVYRWDAALARWIADFGNDAWVESCVRGALADYERSLGEPCRIFSFGDGWHNQASVHLIERLGVRIDLTLEPGCDDSSPSASVELSTGVHPDRRAMPTQPYRPSASDFLKADREGRTQLWFLPMSTGPEHTAWARQRPGFLARLTGAKPPAVKINLGHEPERFMPMFEAAVSTGARPYAAIAVRTDVGSNEGLLRYVETNLQSILNHRLADGFVFMTPTEALALLTR